MENSKIVLWVLISFSAVVLIGALLVHCLMMFGRHASRKKYDKERWGAYCQENSVPNGIDFGFCVLLDRRYSYFSNYLLYVIIDKVFGILSVGYSIIGIMASAIATPQSVGLIVSFLALIFVVMALYVSPNNRMSLYLSKWQECDSKVNHMLGHMECYSKLVDCDQKKAAVDDIMGFIEKCVVGLTDADL